MNIFKPVIRNNFKGNLRNNKLIHGFIYQLKAKFLMWYLIFQFLRLRLHRVALSSVETSQDILSSFRGGYIFEYFTV